MNYMPMQEERVVGERGQVTIPKRMREKEGIRGGDRVIVTDIDGSVVIRKENLKDELKEGYRKMSRRDREISEEMLAASEEALQ